MHCRFLWVFACVVPVSVLAAAPVLADEKSADAAPTEGDWSFRVLLDDKPIGEHRFQVATSGGATTVQSTAQFDVRLLSVNLYRYRHKATERWKGGCLQGLTASTDDNGTAWTVEARAAGTGGLEVVTNGKQSALDGCVMSFAYWNSRMLQQQRLLNAQTGEYDAVQLQALPDEVLTVRGVPTAAKRWRLTGSDKPLTLWYSTTGEWLQLESTVSMGKRLRYVLK